MPPLMLTTNEIEAAILGAQWVQTRAEPELQDAATSLLTKIETILPREFESLFLAPATSVAPADLPPEVLSSAEIRAAVRHRKKLRIRYEDITEPSVSGPSGPFSSDTEITEGSLQRGAS